MSDKKTSQTPLICLVCGDNARGFNFDVMTCMSCKTFFRRHAPGYNRGQSKFLCQGDNNCEITKVTRSVCGACRLKKCFSLKMNPKLIRCSSSSTRISHSYQDFNGLVQNQNLYSKSVLFKRPYNNHTLLKNDEWNLLSNIAHAYDASNIVTHIKDLLEKRSPLLPKIRSKPSNAIPVLKVFYEKLQSFMENIPFFRNLPVTIRLALLENNSEIAGILNAILIARELNALNNMGFLANLSSVYGHEFLIHAHQYVYRLDSNEMLTKIMVTLLLFSTNCSFVDVCHSRDRMNSSMIFSVIGIQNSLITSFWKYLVYEYGFHGAVHRYGTSIKYILDLIQMTHILRTPQHDKMMDLFVEETKRSLIIEYGNKTLHVHS